MKKLLFILIIAAATLSSCMNQEDFRLVGIDDYVLHGISGVDITVRLENNSRRNLHLQDLKMVVFNGNSELGTVIIPEEIVIPKKFRGQVTFPFKVKINDPLALMALGVNMNIEKMNVTGHIKVKAGIYKKTFTFDKKPLTTTHGQLRDLIEI